MSARHSLLKAQEGVLDEQQLTHKLRLQHRQPQQAAVLLSGIERSAQSAESFSSNTHQQQPSASIQATISASALHPVQPLQATDNDQPSSSLYIDTSNSSSNTSSSQSRRRPPANRPRPRRPSPWPSSEAVAPNTTDGKPLQPNIPPVQQPTPANASSSSSSSSSQSRSMEQLISQKLLDKIQAGGLTALPAWEQWGDRQLLQDWNSAVEQLPAVVDRLAGVCQSGPTKLVSFDLETADFGEYFMKAMNLDTALFCYDAQHLSVRLCSQ